MQEINLDFPIKVDGIETDTINIRRATVGDMLNAQKKGTEGEKEISLLATLCTMSPKDFEKIDLSDYNKIKKVVEGFTG